MIQSKTGFLFQFQDHGNEIRAFIDPKRIPKRDREIFRLSQAEALYPS